MAVCVAGCAHPDGARTAARSASLQYLVVAPRPHRIYLIKGGGSRVDFGEFESGIFKPKETFILPTMASDVNRIILVLATIDQSAFDNAYRAPSLPENSFEHGTAFVIVDSGSGIAAERMIRLPPSGPLSPALGREVEATAFFALASALSDYQRGEKLLSEGSYLAAAEDLSRAAREISDWRVSYHGRFWDSGLEDFRPLTAKLAGFDLVLTYEASGHLSRHKASDQRTQFQHIAEAEKETCYSFLLTEQITRVQRGPETIVSFHSRWKGEADLRRDGGEVPPHLLNELRQRELLNTLPRVVGG